MESQNNNVNLKFNRKVFSFLICLALAGLFWLLTALSKEYTVSADLPLKYLNLPKGKNAFTQLPSYTRTTVKAKGFTLLKFRYYFSKDSLLIDARSLRHYGYKLYYYTPNSNLEKVGSNLEPQVKLIRIYPDTLFFSLSSRSVKKVPVKANLVLSFDPQYKLLDTLKITPAMVEISGDAEVIEKISFIETKRTVINNIKSALTEKVALLSPKNTKQVVLSEQTVKIEIPVDRVTEKSYDLPVEVINIPKGKRVKIFPDKVKIKFLIATKDYEKISPEAFKLVADYGKAGNSKNGKLKVEVKQKPVYAKKVTVVPEKLEYIIKK